MPMYDLECNKCKVIEERRLNLKTVENLSSDPVGCSRCDGNLLIVVLSAPLVAIPVKHQASPKKQKPRVPINFIDENPDGTVKVTRIGASKLDD